MKTQNKVVFVMSLLLGLTSHPAWAHRPHDVVTEVELSPAYHVDKTIFIIVRGNLLKSTDGGATWARLTRGLDNTSELATLAVSRKQPDRVFVASSGDGIFRSDDGGQSWLRVPHEPSELSIQMIAVSPHSDDTLLATGRDQNLYRSDDAGRHWSVMLTGKAISAIGFAPDAPGFLVVGAQDGTLAISNDQGKTWRDVNQMSSGGRIVGVAISPNFSQDGTLVVGTERGGVYRSLDHGASFAPINQGIGDKSIQDVAIVKTSANEITLLASGHSEALYVSTDRGDTWVQRGRGLVKDSQADSIHSPHWGKIRASDTFSADHTVYLGGFNGLFQSTDGAQNWRELETLGRGAVTALAISPNFARDQTLAAVTYVGNVYISRDAGRSWFSPSDGLEIPRLEASFKAPKQDPRRFFDITFSPNYGTDHTLFAAVLYSNVLSSEDGGKTWRTASLPAVGKQPTRGLSIVPSPRFAQDQTVFVGTQYGAIYRSTDGGRHFAPLAQLGTHRGGDNALSMVISPEFAADRAMFAGGDVGIYQTRDGGSTWQAIDDPALSTRKTFQLAISPNYAQDGTLLVGTNQGLFTSSDKGRSWRPLHDVVLGDDVYVEGVAFSPDYANDRTFLVTTRGRGLFRTTDGGSHFAPLGDGRLSFARLTNVPSAGVPIRFSPNYAQDKTLYGFGAASSTQVYKSTDGGVAWEILNVPRVVHGAPGLLTSARIWLELKAQKSGVLFKVAVGTLVVAILALIAVVVLRQVRKRGGSAHAAPAA